MRAKTAGAIILGAAFLLLFLSAVLPATAAWPVALPPAGPGGAMWNGRTFEVVIQGFLILAGVFSILLLLGPDRSRGMPP